MPRLIITVYRGIIYLTDFNSKFLLAGKSIPVTIFTVVTMPKTSKRRRTNKKQADNALTEITSQKLATISEGTEEETLEGYLEDFEVQSKLYYKYRVLYTPE